jgi:hypothetical protein
VLQSASESPPATALTAMTRSIRIRSIISVPAFKGLCRNSYRLVGELVNTPSK